MLLHLTVPRDYITKYFSRYLQEVLIHVYQNWRTSSFHSGCRCAHSQRRQLRFPRWPRLTAFLHTSADGHWLSSRIWSKMRSQELMISTAIDCPQACSQRPDDENDDTDNARKISFIVEQLDLPRKRFLAGSIHRSSLFCHTSSSQWVQQRMHHLETKVCSVCRL